MLSPALEHDPEGAVAACRWLAEALAASEEHGQVRRGYVVIGQRSVRVHLPSQDAKTPHIRLLGEFAVLKAFEGHVAEGNARLRLHLVVRLLIRDLLCE